MKCDLELCRQILLRLEAVDQPAGVLSSCYPGDQDLAIEGWSSDDIGYNAGLMAKHGFFNEHSGMDNGCFYFDGISWEGHQYLETVRDPVVWSKTRETASKISGWTFDIVKDIAAGYVKQKASELGL